MCGSIVNNVLIGNNIVIHFIFSTFVTFKRLIPYRNGL